MNELPDTPSTTDKILDSIAHILPEVQLPKRPVPMKERLLWTGGVLTLFFILGEITIYGVSQEAQDYFGFFKAVLASESGTLITLGIGPIVAGGIFMQLFQGAEIFHFDLTSHQGKARYQTAQKMLALFLCLFEAAVYIFAGAFGEYGFGREVFLTLQIGFGAVLVLFMDEVVTKWGFGSGVSLFIVGGVAKDIFWKTFSFLPSSEQGGQLIGAVPGFIQSIVSGAPVLIRTDLPDVVEVAATLLIFLIVVYSETLRITIPLSMGRFKGTKGGYPVRFMYASVIPVIFTMSVFGTFQLFARSIENRFHLGILGQFSATGQAVGGIMYYISPPRGIDQVMRDPERALIYLVIVLVLCAFFARMWTGYVGMDSKSVAQRIQESGMQVAGFQRDIRVIEMMLDKYIPQVTLMGGIAVGLLAILADFTHALGTGTGILLAVMITFRMYTDLVRAPDLPASMRKLLS
ncbi:MAG: preprotein translocase subunit SecY [Theionarchaea archaeon]|nr:preprotein translocase subunit SecY [Theionarchaea archaeon]MBU7021867.1 preprotein translocase subunit SecY [Theionarchaea archaeon]MBU7034319.1 preprotein translocase subunit SecY [Theionarchaea archaeon]MBU7040917.1 preprotein translocase subunit SecY [Theionarchaea archaeon]